MHDHDRGLRFDVLTLMTRRRALQLVAAGGLAAVVGCGSSSSDSAGTAAATTEAAGTTADAAQGATAEIPEETAGPFPADGSNGANVLTDSGIVRSDLASSFGAASATAEGVPLAVSLTILDVAAGGTPAEGAAVYLWHCDREGRYSLYDSAIAGENYLRGVQAVGRRRRARLHHDLAGRLLGPLAPHPLRGLPQPRRGHRRGVEARDLADRPARGRLPAGLRDGRVPAERAEPRPDLAGHRHGLRRRLLDPARHGGRLPAGWG